jgi:RNA polymerase sigma-70 factor (ECF subfamily)
MELTDIELMEKVRDGDHRCFEILLLRHHKSLINFFFRLCWNQALAEDLAQDTFLRVFQARHNYQAISKFNTYLYRIARNLWVDHVRKISRQGNKFSLDAPISEGLTLSDLLVTQDRGDEKARELEEKMAKIQKAICQLGQAQQELFALVNVQKLKYRQISEILKIPEGTVKTRMHALMKKLRQVMLKEGI